METISQYNGVYRSYADFINCNYPPLQRLHGVTHLLEFIGRTQWSSLRSICQCSFIARHC